MRLEATVRDVIALIPKPCVVGSNPTAGAIWMRATRETASMLAARMACRGTSRAISTVGLVRVRCARVANGG